MHNAPKFARKGPSILPAWVPLSCPNLMQIWSIARRGRIGRGPRCAPRPVRPLPPPSFPLLPPRCACPPAGFLRPCPRYWLFAPWARPPKVPPLPPVSVTRRARKRAALTPLSPLQIQIGRRGPLVSVPRSITAPAGGQGGHLATEDIRRRPRPLRRMAWAPMAPGSKLERSPPCAVWRLSAATPGLSCPCVPAVAARGAAHSAVATRAASRRAPAGVPHPPPELRRQPPL